MCSVKFAYFLRHSKFSHVLLSMHAIRSLPGHLIPQLDWTAAKGKTTADFGITHIFSIFLFFDSRAGSCQPVFGVIITNRSLSYAKVALVSFSGKNHRHLGSRNIVRSRGCAFQDKGVTLSAIFITLLSNCDISL